MSTDTTTQDDQSRDETAETPPASTNDRTPDNAEREPIDVVHEPPRLSQGIAVAGAVLGAVLTVPFVTLAIPFGISGVVIVAASMLVHPSRRWLSVGSGLLMSGVIFAGIYGAVPSELMVIAVVAIVIGWDQGKYGLDLGDQIGREPRSVRAQSVHVALTAVALSLISMAAYVTSIVSGDGRPGPAVALVILGVVMLAWLIRN